MLVDHEVSMIRLETLIRRVGVSMSCEEFIRAVNTAYCEVEARRHTTEIHEYFHRSGAHGHFRQALTTAAQLLPRPLAILDVGCGAGYDLGVIREVFPRDQVERLVGLDISADMMAHIRAVADGYSCRMVLGSLIDVPDYQGWAAGWPRFPVPVIARWCASTSCVSPATGRAVDPYTFRLERASLRRADFHCAKSAHLAKQTQQVFHIAGEPPVILNNLIDISAGESSGLRTANQVVFAGTLNTNKGIIPLVNAWPRVLDVYPDAELHVFGKDGRAPDGRSMKAFLESLLDNRQRQSIHFHGHVDRSVLLARLAVARAAVFPSRFEGCPGAPLEAMACGCPTIISSRVPPEIFEGFDGLKIDPDYPEQIAEAIGDDRLAEHYSAAGQRHVQAQFSRPAVVAKNEAFYRRCLDAFHPFRPVRPGKLPLARISPGLVANRTD